MEIRAEAYETYIILQKRKAQKKDQERIKRQDLTGHISNNRERIRKRIHG